ncbi:DUF58 domain-containing protein [Tessaracoccus rhinocerotis]|uniref:DUF58 domain-containing protein n=1 Tax=Tessaracoccus rhinocerotis TaxID=1689449 RepID=A0A553JZJ0_9ACTN|nr:DUF58 domain-containing protein [Tessaracoccus rhinocerotis]TRY17869.1 DUF58 domain-containing protein [Tessaracoccus rhinocerotis]
MKFHATAALVRSQVCALLLGVLALLFGRLDLLVLAVPFLVHACWGLLSRPRRGVEVTARPRHVVVPEGDVVRVTVASAPGHLAAVQWGQVESADWDPATGTLLDAPDDGTVAFGFEPERWGRYEIAPALFQVTDPSGSWSCSGATEGITVTVRPAAATLDGGSGVAHPIGMVGSHRSRHRGDGSDLAEVREFRVGDRLRRINWRVTSRRGPVHVNSMLTERDTDVLIVVDTLYDITPADRHATTSLDATVRAVAAIAQHYVGFGDRVAVHDLGTRIGPIRSGSGPRQARMVRDVLARARRTGRDWTRVQQVPSIASGTLVFLCSPLLEREVQDELVRLRRLGAEVIGVDTLPEGVGEFADIRTFDKGSHLGEAWLLRRMQRDDALTRLRALGIPVTRWRGTSSLANVLLSMEAARSAPRRGVAR